MADPRLNLEAVKDAAALRAAGRPIAGIPTPEEFFEVPDDRGFFGRIFRDPPADPLRDAVRSRDNLYNPQTPEGASLEADWKAFERTKSHELRMKDAELQRLQDELDKGGLSFDRAEEITQAQKKIRDERKKISDQISPDGRAKFGQGLVDEAERNVQRARQAAEPEARRAFEAKVNQLTAKQKRGARFRRAAMRGGVAATILGGGALATGLYRSRSDSAKGAIETISSNGGILSPQQYAEVAGELGADVADRLIEMAIGAEEEGGSLFESLRYAQEVANEVPDWAIPTGKDFISSIPQEEGFTPSSAGLPPENPTKETLRALEEAPNPLDPDETKLGPRIENLPAPGLGDQPILISAGDELSGDPRLRDPAAEYQYDGENPMEVFDRQPELFAGMDEGQLMDLVNNHYRVGLANLAGLFNEGGPAPEDMNPIQLAAQRYAMGEENLAGQDLDTQTGRMASGYDGLVQRFLSGLPMIGNYSDQDRSEMVDAAGMFIPSADDIVSVPFDLGGLVNQFVSLSDGARDTVRPLMSEAAIMMGREPLAPLIPAQAGPPLPQTPDQPFGPAGQPTEDNRYNNPQSYIDLLQMEAQGMLPFPGNAAANAQRLGLSVPTGAAPADVEPPALQRREVSPDEVIDGLLQDDKVVMPDGQFEAPVRPQPPSETAPFDPASLIEMPDRIPFAAMADGSDVSLRQVQPSMPALPGLEDDIRALSIDPPPPSTGDMAAPRPAAGGASAAGLGPLRPAARPGDFNKSREGDPATLADDARMAEEKLNGINTYLRDKLGMDETERRAMSQMLIQLGATMMTTPGGLLQGLGAGLGAGAEAFQGSLAQQHQQMLDEAESRRKAEAAGLDAEYTRAQIEKLRAETKRQAEVVAMTEFGVPFEDLPARDKSIIIETMRIMRDDPSVSRAEASSIAQQNVDKANPFYDMMRASLPRE